MKESLLAHLFAIARRESARPLPEQVPFGLETAVLAHWRAAAAQPSDNGNFLRGLRWAALIACAAALLAGALENDQLAAFNNRFDPETRVPDSAIAAGYGYE
ncbi:MAG: hypothetical protein ACRD5Z_02265 [Bryobacteraceae bacterium]